MCFVTQDCKKQFVILLYILFYAYSENECICHFFYFFYIRITLSFPYTFMAQFNVWEIVGLKSCGHLGQLSYDSFLVWINVLSVSHFGVEWEIEPV